MNITQENMERYVPIIIQFETNTYVGFITEKESNSEVIKPETYRKFMGMSKSVYPRIVEREKPAIDDFVYKISLGLYFHASCGLRENGKRYNLNKIKHELNNRK